MNYRIIQSKMSTKLILSVVIFSIFIFSTERVNAIPAYPKPIEAILPDGTKLTVKKYGDEFFNWTTTMSGHTIMQKEGYYYYVKYSGDGSITFTNQRVSQNRSNLNERAFLSSFTPQNMTIVASFASESRRRSVFAGERNAKFPNEGNIKSIVILVQYQDVKFIGSDTRTAFWNLLNKPGYSNYGATGSARDYFFSA